MNVFNVGAKIGCMVDFVLEKLDLVSAATICSYREKMGVLTMPVTLLPINRGGCTLLSFASRK